MAKSAKIIHICSNCGKTATESTISSSFYISDSIYFKNTGRTPLCKDCIMELSFDGDRLNMNKFKDVLKVVDKPFLNNIFKASKEKCTDIDTGIINDIDAFKEYMKNIVMPQYRGLVWSDSDKIQNEASKDELFDKTERINVVNRWGNAWNDLEYKRLEEFYHSMKRANKIETPQEEDYLKKLSRLSIKIDEAIENGETTKAKQLGDLYSKYMTDSKFRTTDMSDADKQGGIRTFSDIYTEVESEGFIPPWEYYRKLKGVKQDIVDKTIMHIENFTLRFNNAERMKNPPIDTPIVEEEEIDGEV